MMEEKEYARFNAVILGSLVVLILLIIFNVPLVDVSCMGAFCIEPLDVIAILPVVLLLVISAVGMLVSISRLFEQRAKLAPITTEITTESIS